MDIEDLRLLAEVVQEGSFAAVSRRRNLDPSTVSRIIAALERELGARLFQRTSRRLSLTEAGTAYYERLRTALDELERGREETLQFTARPVGTVRVTTSLAFGHTLIVPLLPRWRDTFPSLSLDLVLTDAIVDLISERIDVAIRIGARPQSGMIGARLLPSRYRACASGRYLSQHPAPRTPTDLERHSCVVFKWPGATSEWRFRNAEGKDVIVSLNGPITISSALSVRQAAVDGLGPTLLPDWLVAADLASGALVDLFPEYEAGIADSDTAAWFLYPTRTYLPQRVRVFIDFIRQHVGHAAPDA
ncbi:MAG TPA: LysR family transcriptional regulator [Povalibacter sp.]|nr:LysR family transcriptional regulator [Povalibacter sp.]